MDGFAAQRTVEIAIGRLKGLVVQEMWHSLKYVWSQPQELQCPLSTIQIHMRNCQCFHILKFGVVKMMSISSSYSQKIKDAMVKIL